jgi:AcrR family transcriptional regulator
MRMFELDRLRTRHGTGVYAPGQARVMQILNTALQILVEQGYHAVTLREIARRCEVRVGVVTYYYKTKEALVRDLFDAIIGSYEDVFNDILDNAELQPEQKLGAVIDVILDDITTQQTTNVFPELWALANHDAFVATIVDESYRRARRVLNRLIAEIRPDLPDDERETLALYISASLEGLTMFAGHGKPWRERMPWLKNIACHALLSAVLSLNPKTIRQRS